MIKTNGHTATLKISTQAEADEWVPKLIKTRITRRELVIDGATGEIDLHDCGAIDRCYGGWKTLVQWNEGRVDKITVRNCPRDIVDDMECECGHADIEFEKEAAEAAKGE